MVESVEEEKLQFVPKERLLKNLESELQVSVPSDKKLSTDCATSTMDGYFSCTICLMVVEKPQECVQCN